MDLNNKPINIWEENINMSLRKLYGQNVKSTFKNNKIRNANSF